MCAHGVRASTSPCGVATAALEHRLYHAFDEPLRLVVHIDFRTPADAERFMSDPGLLDVMARAGVVGEPSIRMSTLDERKATG